MALSFLLTAQTHADYVTEQYRRRLYCAVLLLLLALTWLIYAPGLQGGFLFDDFANLPALGATGPVDNWPTFWRYITSGHADPTGRPLAMLSFLVDAHDWPAAPLPFKRSNLLLHLFNGMLLAQLLRALGAAAANQGFLKPVSIIRIDLAALLGAGLWLMHPLLVSTTLYVVQREAMLAATFTLLGLLGWLRGRHLVLSGRVAKGLLWLSLGLPLCTLFALLSKANGILLPMLVLSIEYTLMRAPSSSAEAGEVPRKSRLAYLYAMAAMAWLPSLLVTVYVAEQGWQGLAHGISSVRSWTLGERLLTEPRIVLDYLHLLWLPRPFTPGLFNDQVRVSTSLLSPATTLPSILGVIGLIVGSLRYRRRYPAWALAFLFYFAGQSLESSTIPLELYFEHRNYLPAMLMFWPLALWLCGVRQSLRATAIIETAGHESPLQRVAAALGLPSKTARRREATSAKAPIGVWKVAKPAVTVALLVGVAGMTHALAAVWGNTRDQTLLWAALNPDSPRAQADAASSDMSLGFPGRAAARLESALSKSPDQIQLAMNLFDAQCALGHVNQTTLTQFDLALRTTHDPGPLLVYWFSREMDLVRKDNCAERSFDRLGKFLNIAATNRNLNSIYGRRQDIHYLQGRIALVQGDANSALNEFNRALDEDVQAPIALQQAALLGSLGYPRQGLAHLDHYTAVQKNATVHGLNMATLHSWVLQRQAYWSREVAQLRYTLNKNTAIQ